MQRMMSVEERLSELEARFDSFVAFTLGSLPTRESPDGTYLIVDTTVTPNIILASRESDKEGEALALLVECQRESGKGAGIVLQRVSSGATPEDV